MEGDYIEEIKECVTNAEAVLIFKSIESDIRASERAKVLREVAEAVKGIIEKNDAEDEDREAGYHSQRSVAHIYALFGGPLHGSPGGRFHVEKDGP